MLQLSTLPTADFYQKDERPQPGTLTYSPYYKKRNAYHRDALFIIIIIIISPYFVRIFFKSSVPVVFPALEPILSSYQNSTSRSMLLVQPS